MKDLDFYYITKATCAVIPVEKYVSKVIELDETFIVNKSVMQIIDDSCKYFGSTYKGRFEGTKKILNMNYKLPIVIEEYNNLIFFPTSSPRFNDCIWISLNNIEKYERLNCCSKIIFRKNLEFELDLSYYALENQIFRASMLDSMLRRRRSD